MADSSEKVDRISALPDDLLCQILSRLPIKEATASSVLSPRWRFLITSLLDINLEYSTDPLDESEPIQQEQSLLQFFDFINFCNTLILRRNRAPIRKFQLVIYPPSLFERFQLQINSLISAVLLCSVQELEIWLCENITNRSNLLAAGIFTCKPLVVLKTDRRIDLDVPHLVDLPNLKVLQLDTFSFAGEDSLHILIQGCPLLEELCLDIVEYPTNLSDQLSGSGIFRCKTLVRLKISWEVGLHLDNIFLPNSVCLPNLKELTLKDFTLVSKHSLKRLIHGCPLLEELNLLELDCSNHTSDAFEISSTSVKKLILYCSLKDDHTVFLDLISLQCLEYKANGGLNFFINSPSLEDLNYFGNAVGVSSMKTPEHVISATIVVQSRFTNRIESRSLHANAAYQFINYLQNVKSFCITECTLEALYYSPHPFPIFKNLINLHFDFNEQSYGSGAFRIYWWKVFPRLLQNTPNLEVLVLDKAYWKNLERDREFTSLLPVAFPVSCIERIREMEIKSFIMLENNCSLVEYFLLNGKALKRMTLGALLLPLDWERISYRKSSEDCEIVFRQVHHWHEEDSD